jgi:3-hydroxybutyryl-CoA dehydrogenase
VDVKDVNKVAVIGAGTMGPGLAQVFATSGREVWLCDREQAILDQAMAVIASSLETFVRHGLIREDDVPAVLERVRLTESLSDAADGADLVIECITENLDAKTAVFAELDRACPAGAILTSNTSYLDIFSVVPERRLPDTVIAHWFAPPQIVPLVEVVKGAATSPETVAVIVELLESVDHVPVVLEKFVPGFCVNRFLRIIGREIFFLLDNGYMTAEQLDLAVKASIIPRAMVLGSCRGTTSPVWTSASTTCRTRTSWSRRSTTARAVSWSMSRAASWASRAARASMTTATATSVRSCALATTPSSRCSTSPET